MRITYTALTIVLIFLLLVACDRDDIIQPEHDFPTGISHVRAYSYDQKILVEWHTWSGFIDFGLSAPPVRRTELSMSTSDEESDFEVIYIGNTEGSDSVEINGLQNNIPYYFRLETYGNDGRRIGTSRPIITIPGKLPQEILSHEISGSDVYSTYTNISWSPSGEELAYIDFDGSGYKNVHILNRNTNSVRIVTNHEAEALWDVSWSPDGLHLAYMQSPSITVAYLNYRIWLLDLVTLNTLPVSSGPVDSELAWLSDTQIIFAKGTKGPPNIPELTLLDLDDGSETALTSDGILYKYSPNVNRETGEIVYSAHKSGDRNSYIYITTVGNGAGHLLIENEYWTMMNPVWSPDGSKIYFTSNRSGQDEIWSVRMVDKVFQQVTRGGQVGSSRSFTSINNSGTLLAFIQREADRSEFLKVIALE